MVNEERNEGREPGASTLTDATIMGSSIHEVERSSGLVRGTQCNFGDEEAELV